MTKSEVIEKAYLINDKILVETDIKIAASGLLINTGNNTLLKGLVVKTGPGLINPGASSTESWKDPSESVSYIALQCKRGDWVYFYPKSAIPIIIDDMHFYIISQSDIILGLKK
jgi:co-chaperonin GroES (HSP10)